MFKWLIDFWNASDYHKHLLVGMALGAIFVGVFARFTSPVSSFFWSLGLVCFIGLLKELYDKYIKKTEFDPKDWLMTTEGGFVGAFLGMIVAALIAI